MEYEIGKIYETPIGPKLYLGGDTKDTNSWVSPVLQGPAASVVKGFSYATSDEVIGNIRGTVDKRITRKQAEELERASQRYYESKSPGKALAAETAGVLGTTVATRGAIKPGPVSQQKIGRAMVESGIASGAYGAGEATGGFADRAASAVTYGVGGAAAGTLLGLGTRAIARFGKNIKESFKTPEKIGTEAARKLVKKALDYDSTNIDEAILFITKERTGKPYILADMGPNTRGILDAVNVLPGPGRQQAQKFLLDRNKGMLTRITSDLQEAFGNRASYFDTYKALEVARKEGGDKLYNAAFRKTTGGARQIPIDAALVNLLERPSLQTAFKRAYELAADKGVKLPRINLKNGKMYTAKGGLVKEADTKLMHWIKLALDEQIYTGRNPQSGIGPTSLNAIRDNKTKLLDIMDSANPAYKKARDQWADQASIMDSLDRGMKFDTYGKVDTDFLLDDLAKMSKSEIEAFRTGVLNNLMKKLEDAVYDPQRGTGANLAQRLIRNETSRKLLRLTFPQDARGQKKFNQFMQNLQDEIELKSTASTIIGNSTTAARQEATSFIEGLVKPGEVQNLSPVGLMFSVIKADYPELAQEAQEAASKELARILTENNPQALRKIAKEIQEKGTFKGIIKKYIPKAGTEAIRTTVAPRMVGTELGILGGRVFEGDTIADINARLGIQEE